MRYVRLNTNAVAEVGYFDGIEGRFHPSLIWLASDAAEIGDLWDGETFTAPPAPPVPIPQQVTMRQARLALLKAGLLSDIPGAIATLPSPQKEEAEIEWEYAAIVQRNSGLVPTMGLALGLTEQQLDEMFTLAATL